MKLKYLQPQQYESWLRKVDDPDWYEHRYRDAKDNAMASAIRELRDEKEMTKNLLDSLKEILYLAKEWGTDPKYYTQAERNIIWFAEDLIDKAGE